MTFDIVNFVRSAAYGNGACPSCSGSQLSALTDPKGNTWSFNYDQYGRLTNTANPLGQAKAYAYDKMSRVAEVKDPAGNVTQYTYDVLKRLTKKDIATPAGNHSITDYSYDAVGNLLSIANGGSAVSYTYDQLNRPVSATQSFDGKAYTLDYAYDAVGNRTAMATPWGKYSYTYDALNRLTGIVNPQGITVAFGYDAAGRRTSKKIFKVAPAIMAEAEYNYDAAGQLTEIVNKAGGKVVAFNKYQYDANGNRTRIEDQDGIWDYKYDAANRLIVAIPWPVDYVKAEAFVYDKNGNRRYDKTAWDYHYDAANRLVANSTYTYTHDQNGNLTARTNRFDNSQFTYAYTPEQQLSDVTTPEHKVQYKYDPLGRRTEKVVDGKTTKFIYDGQDIIAELDDANAAINTYTNGPGIDEPLIMTKPDGKAYYYHADALGSIKTITDDNGNIVETYKYKAYGQPTIRGAKGQPIPTSIIGNTRMFAAREYEQEIGFYNNRHRYLDPSRGAFTQEDPISFSGGTLSFYLYALENPLKYGDPTGLFGLEDMPSIPQGLVDFTAGYGDTFTGGVTKYARDSLSEIGLGDSVNDCSSAYGYGKSAAYIHGAAMVVAGGLNGGANSVFWSGGKSAQAAAETFGTTIGKTPVGAILNYIHPSVEEILGKQAANYMWRLPSRIFAENATGNAQAVIRSVNPESIWMSIEKPIIERNGIPIIYR